MEDIELKKKNNKQPILLIFVIIMSLGLSLGAIYFMYYYKDVKNNKLETDTINIDYEEVSFSVNSNLPVVDDVGMKGTPYECNVTNKSKVPIDVDIELHIDKDVTNIDSNAIKYGLYINNQFIKKDYINTNGEDFITIHTFKDLVVNGSINCKIYFWTDYYYKTPNKVFEGTIEAVGVTHDVIDERS